MSELNGMMNWRILIALLLLGVFAVEARAAESPTAPEPPIPGVFSLQTPPAPAFTAQGSKAVTNKITLAAPLPSAPLKALPSAPPAPPLAAATPATAATPAPSISLTPLSAAQASAPTETPEPVATFIPFAPPTPSTEVVELTAELKTAQTSLAQKDELIERLSRHLENALARLNETNSPVASEDSSVAALKAVRLQLEQQNNLLRLKKEQMEGQLAELSKKSQLLDLENRQLFEALNGTPYEERGEKNYPAKNGTKTVKKDRLVWGE